MFNSKYYHGASAAEAYAHADKHLFDSSQGGLGYQVFTVPAGEKFIGTNFKLNPNATLGYSDGTYTYRPDDWYDETFKNSFRQEYNVSVNGQAERLSYYANVSYLNDGGTVDNSGFERYSARTNVEYQAKDWLRLSTNMSFSNNQSKTPYYTDDYGSSGNLFYIVNNIGPIYPLYVRDAEGNIMTENGRVVYDSNQTNFARPNFMGNAVRDNMYDRYKGTTETFNGKWAATITPVEGLALQATLSTTNITSRSSSLYSRFGQGSDTDGAVSVSAGRKFTVNQLYTANYSANIDDIHHFDLLAGYEQYNVTDQSVGGYNTNLFNPFIGELNNAHGIKYLQASSSTGKYMTEGFFGRFQYDYAEKYFFNASARRDASSRFHKDNRWGTFGSFGLAWQMNKEKFLENATWIDLLKAKISWGAMGNDGVSNYASSYVPYADMYEVSYNEATGEYSTNLKQKGNKDLTWETNKQWNIGVDFSFFKYRLNGSIDFFHRETTDMLYKKSLSLSSGISAPYIPMNIGSMVNKGIELALDGAIFRSKNFEWNVNLNMTHFTNEITSLDPQVEAAGGEKYGNQILRKGGSIYELYLVKFAGTDKSNGQALYYTDVKDAEGKVIGRTTTNSLDAATQYECGTTLPDLTGGFGTTVRFHDFDLTAQFSYSIGGKMYDGVYQSLMHAGAEKGKAMHKDLLNAWSPENPTSNIPRLSTAAADGFGQTAIDRFVVGSDYLALNNLTLGYTLPKSILLPLGVSSLRVYVAGENLFLLSERQGLDPRYNYGMGSMTSGGGLSSGMYAAMRSITAGITLKF
jgi:TonB-linked SusC/RagA family outer membrane protein